MILIGENRQYLSGFTGEDNGFDESAGALFISEDRLVLATDSRFDLQAKNEAPMFNIFCYKKGLAKELKHIVTHMGAKRLGFESARLSFKQHEEFQKALEKMDEAIALVPTENMVEDIRVIKSEDEIIKTKKALEIAESSFDLVVKILKPGMSEKEAAWALEKAMREKGAERLSFPVIVASGPNSALPHAIPTDRKFEVGEPILFDWGAVLDGYCSDISRTVVLGKPDEMFKKVYDTVRYAQKKAIDAIRSGEHSKAIDAIARDHIREQGFKGKFGHGLGHGTGLAIHESPRLSPIKDMVLESGMLVTVEPGVYIPEWGGVRIENQVVVREQHAQVLNTTQTTMQCIDV